jgi:uncharacterized protein GlcG (DUF336 family)
MEFIMGTANTYKTNSVTLEAAQQAINAGVAAAGELGIPMALAVVDSSGNLKASARMDGASILSHDVSFKKAWTSAMSGAPTAGVHQFVASDPAAALSMPHMDNFSVIAGGLPLQSEGACVGGVGSSGATAELDQKVAEAMAAVLA